MKNTLLFSLFVALCPVAAIAQDDVKAPDRELAEWEKAYSNLPKEKRVDYEQHMNKARELFQQKRIFETVDELEQASLIFPDSPDLENLFGAAQVEFRSFDKALEHFEKANKLSPDNPSVLFNIAEVQFVAKQWEEAEVSMAHVLSMIEEDENKMQMARLVEFKLMLTKIKLGKMEEAEKMALKYDHLDDSPYCYFAEAAMAYQAGNDVEAEAAMARAGRIFRQANLISPWQDTMMEFGYIRSFFGGELEEEE